VETAVVGDSKIFKGDNEITQLALTDKGTDKVVGIYPSRRTGSSIFR